MTGGGDNAGVLDADVVVAGAGPAGIATAVAVAGLMPELAEQGRIVCFDKARFPREKPCGGGLTGHAREALHHLGLSVRVPAVACPKGRIVYGRESRTVVLERPVEVVRREEFDADLVAQARARGVVVIEGEGVVSHAVDGARGRVSVTTSLGRQLAPRVLVGADGAGSRIRKQVLAGDPHQPQRPLRLYKLELPAPAAAALSDEMVYDFSPMVDGLRGYVWLFPVSDGRLNVGAMHTQSRRLSATRILEILAATLARHGVTLPANARGWPAWPYAPRSRLSTPHVLCVGDAAGIDALTGEGIAVGLEHGPLAGAAIADGFARGDFSFASFSAAVRVATVGRELALDQRLASLLYAPRGYRFWLSLVMFDARMRKMYASRVCGSDVLADRGAALAGAFARHLLASPVRLARLGRAVAHDAPVTAGA